MSSHASPGPDFQAINAKPFCRRSSPKPQKSKSREDGRVNERPGKTRDLLGFLAVTECQRQPPPGARPTRRCVADEVQISIRWVLTPIAPVLRDGVTKLSAGVCSLRWNTAGIDVVADILPVSLAVLLRKGRRALHVAL